MSRVQHELSCNNHSLLDQSVAESYITHIRITEDSSSPSSPPPPDSAPGNKKTRAIIVAVKRSGRVRLHKARENNNGTFSIGKTWVLDDLTAIESFTGSTPITYEEQQRKEWAGDSGVLVTIQKPYFWQTATAKEKDFFIGSLVKIYRKYTKGREPTLTGFQERELAEFSSSTSQRSKPSQPPSNSSSPAPTNASASFDSPLPPYAGGMTVRSSGPSQETLPSYAGGPPLRSPRPSQETNGGGNRDLRPPSAGSTSTREAEQQDRPPLPGASVANESSQSLRPRDAATRVQKLRSGSSSSTKHDAIRPTTPRSDATFKASGPDSSLESLPNSRFDARASPALNGDRPRANGSYSPFPRKDAGPFPPPEQPLAPGPKSPERRPGSSDQQIQRPPSSGSEALPQRKRPPLLATGSTQEHSGRSTPGGFVTPKESISPEPSKGNAAAPDTNAQEQPKRSAADFFLAASKRMKELDGKGPVASDAISETPTDMKDVSQALSSVLSSPSEAPDSPEEHRPGLGPMIRKKKSSKEVATAFRKAAVAHNAFRPRIGGAGERLRDELTKTPNTPDGIHGVFVAPSKEALKSPQPPASAASEEIMSPEPLDIARETVASPAPPSVEVKRASDVPGIPPLSIPNAEEKKEVTPRKEEETKKRPSDYSAKYAKALGIDPLLLEGRTLEIDSVLTDFGWTDSEKMKKSFEDLQTDIRRDLSKIETGSWLGSFEHGDERVSAVDRLLDKAIAECEELDGLLTLYNVELGVGPVTAELRFKLMLHRHWPTTLHILRLSPKGCKFKLLIKDCSKRSSTTFCRQYLSRLLSSTSYAMQSSGSGMVSRK